ncbi:MAG: zinc ribbon domain-containing protein [Candidatus Methylopumilus sp.]|jgi:putative FmdB family regulatory protein
MPLYEYACTTCGVFSALRRMSESALPAMCEECGEISERIVSAPHLAILEKSQRTAHERNEKSAHEPKTARRSSCGCAGSHTCGTGAAESKAKSASATKANPQGLQMQTKKTARPWMLAH